MKKPIEKISIQEMLAEIMAYAVQAIQNRKEIDRIELLTAQDRGLLYSLAQQVADLIEKSKK